MVSLGSSIGCIPSKTMAPFVRWSGKRPFRTSGHGIYLTTEYLEVDLLKIVVEVICILQLLKENGWFESCTDRGSLSNDLK
jgi:hypothetical protein